MHLYSAQHEPKKEMRLNARTLRLRSTRLILNMMISYLLKLDVSVTTIETRWPL